MPKIKKNTATVISAKDEFFSSKEYASTLADMKEHIRKSQLEAVFAVNKELLHLYWETGKMLVKKQESYGWGAKFIEKLSKDLQSEFPGIKGFSNRNLFRIKLFYSEYAIVPPAVAQLHDFDQLGPLTQIPWSHNMLAIWIDARLHSREGKAITNFKNTLPPLQSDLAQQTLKDPYLFDFLTLHQDYLEKDLEEGLINHIQKFLLELGHGFAFMGRQYLLNIEGDPYYIDLLFYHVKLRCFVVLELKARAFKPEDTGQLNFYLSAVDDCLKSPDDNPTIGILLCKTRNKIKAEYAFRHINRPMEVVEYETILTKSLPENLKSNLPTIKEIESELARETDS